MNAKKLLVSFLAVMSVLLVVMTVSATSHNLVNVDDVKVNGLVSGPGGSDYISVIAGEILTIEVFFTADKTASDVRLEAELEGAKIDSETEVFVGDLEEGKKYREVLTLKVPYELKDVVSDNLELEIKVFNGDFKTEFADIILRVQRPAYNAAVMLIQTNNVINVGETMLVDIVLKNIGYNDLDDTYVTVKVPALGLEKTGFFGDIVAIECDEDATDFSLDNYGVEGIDRKCNEDDENTVRGRIFLNVPYDTDTGIYTLEVEVTNDDLNVLQTKQIFIENDLPETVFKSGTDLIVVNPTNKVKVYTIIPESPATVSESVVVVPAGSSRTVTVNPNTSEGVSVNVLSGGTLVGTVKFAGVAKATGSDPIIVLTIVLAIIFIVLVIVLLVLLTRKPEKEEEFSESYY